ncbi:type IV secretory system conjugative DNA transfer family protein [Amycolatopsis sp. CA-161197]|uniref:type IV secretory system conjugative DNA transfer family protein n=1 Tax=Amycolatopsis sp. CA-161197 TaxID=3239922 RepID=UPI003D8AE9BB
MTRTHTAAAGLDRDVVLVALVVGAVVVLLVLAATFVVAAALTTGLSTGSWAWPPLSRWPEFAARLVTDPAAPGRDLPTPWSEGITGHEAAYYLYFSTLFLVLVSLTAGVSVPAWRRLGPSEAGHASRRDIRTNLSESAARKTASWTRPDLVARDRRRMPAESIGVPLHRGPHRERLLTSLENPTGVIAPTRSGKSRTDLVHKMLAAPGALLASTTKDDLAEWGLLARSRRPIGGTAWLLDMTGTVSWPRHVRWNPVAGCGSPVVALRRAETLIETSALGLEGVGGNDKVFRGRAIIVLQAYLLAAALHGRTVDDLVNWAITKPPDQEPVQLLHRKYPQLAFNLRSEIGMVAETSDAVWMSVRRAIEPFMNPDIRWLCTPSADEAFDVDSLLESHGSVFVIAGQHQAPQARPVLTAFAEQIITTAQERALNTEHRRLVPPMTAILDEIYEGTPIPRLPGFISDSAGRGVVIHWSAQSRAQLDELYGENGRQTLIDNTLTLSIFPGLKDDRTLEWLSTISADHRRPTYQHHSDGLLGAGRGSVGFETVPTYRPGDIRTLARRRVLILHSNLKPVLGRAIDVTKRRDWPQLEADVSAIRGGRGADALAATRSGEARE